MRLFDLAFHQKALAYEPLRKPADSAMLHLRLSLRAAYILLDLQDALAIGWILGALGNTQRTLHATSKHSS